MVKLVVVKGEDGLCLLIKVNFHLQGLIERRAEPKLSN